MENDLREALIALPERLFYNTGIAMYVGVVTNRKARARKGKVVPVGCGAGASSSPQRSKLHEGRDVAETPLVPIQRFLLQLT